ncbi:MAG: ABC transporter permease, partial [Desulfobacterales bacterium]|nr:ABC transporter permease [Desulfobacterales bacterium]
PLPVPAFLHVTLAVLAGFAGGLIWGYIPGYLRAYRGVSEIVVTLMLNYVGIYFINWLVEEPHPLAELNTTFPQSPIIEKSAQLPILIKGTSMHAGIILAVVLGLILYLLLRYTPFGFKTRMIGQNPEAARYAGVRVKRQILFAMLISGGFGGLAGASEVLGLKLRLFDFFVGGVGYEAIAVALLANANLLGVIFSAFFFGALKAGANKMQIVSGVESSMALIVMALAVLFVIAIGFGERRFRPKRKKDKDSTERGIKTYGD